MLRSVLPVLALLSAGTILPAQQNPDAPFTPIRKPEVVNESDVDKLVQKAAGQKDAGDQIGAAATLESALQKVRSTPLLKHREDEVRARLGHAYLTVLRLDDAARTFAPLFDSQRRNCRAGLSRDTCSDALYGMGAYYMYKSDFPPAVVLLHKAVAECAKAPTPDSTEEYRMTKLKEQGDAEGLLGAALFRTGKKDQAIDALHHAIDQLRIVEQNDRMPELLRAGARASMKDANTSLELLLKN